MNFDRPNISIIIPCLDEADSIPIVIPELIENAKDQNLEIIVVDDCSSDNSCALIEKYKEVILVKNSQRLGYGGSLKRGFQIAKGRYLAFLDLDRTYSSSDLNKLYQEILEKDLSIVFGDRMSQKNEMPRTRYVGNWLYASLLEILFRVKISDVCTGFRIFKRELISKVVQLPENGLNFSIAFTVLVLRIKVPFSQIPIRYDERIGRSKLSVISDGFLFLKSIFTNYFRTIE